MCLFELSILPLGRFHGLRLELLSIPIHSNEYAPTGEQQSNCNQQACRVCEVSHVFMDRLEGCHEPLDCKRDYDPQQEPRQNTTYACRGADVRVANDFFFSDRLLNLERDNTGSQQAYRFNQP